jgi:hypothetical protein
LLHGRQQRRLVRGNQGAFRDAGATGDAGNWRPDPCVLELDFSARQLRFRDINIGFRFTSASEEILVFLFADCLALDQFLGAPGVQASRSQGVAGG